MPGGLPGWHQGDSSAYAGEVLPPNMWGIRDIYLWSRPDVLRAVGHNRGGYSLNELHLVVASGRNNTGGDAGGC